MRVFSSILSIFFIAGHGVKDVQAFFLPNNIQTSSKEVFTSFSKSVGSDVSRHTDTQLYYHHNEDGVDNSQKDRHKISRNKKRNNSNNRRRTYSHPTRSNNNNNRYDNKRRRQKQNRMQQEKQQWLKTTTSNILETDPGSLLKGKWHELVSMIRAWSKYSKYVPEAPLAIERLIKRLLDERNAGNKEAKADIQLYNILLDSWACSAIFRTQEPAIASQRAREILVLLQETYEKENDETLQPNAESFGIVFHAVMKAEGSKRARIVFAWMEYLAKTNRNKYAEPTRRQYIYLLDAYANSRAINAGHLAEGFIRHMKMTGIQPETVCYNIAIKAWTKAKRGRESAEHADRILDEMDVEKDLITYSTVISAWAASGMKAHAVDRAEALLRKIEETPGLEPNTVVLNSVMSTWVKSRNPAAVNRTAELLEEMKGLGSHAQPDLISYNTHIHALAVHSKRPGYARRANDLLLELEEMYKNKKVSFRPNLFTFNTVIDAWSKSLDYDAAWKAVRVLRQLIDNQDKNGPDPDHFSFNCVLSALSRSAKPGTALLAEKLLRYMEDAYKMQMYDDARPDVASYTSVIVALARCDDDDAPDRAERLFNHMKDRYVNFGEKRMKPNIRCYNALIDVWAKSGRGTFAARKAEALLREMSDMFDAGDDSVAPNIITYNAVLNAWAQSGTRCCANKAEGYLDRLWELYNDGDGDLGPNDKSFNTVINAISKSQNKYKAQKALRILRRMDKLYQAGYKDARPNEVTYTSVLNSCAFPATLDQLTRRKALHTAKFTLHELQASRYGQPNEVTYGTFLKACANLLTDDDEMLRVVIEEAFRQCCRDGQVGEMVLSYLREAAPEDLYRELLDEVVETSDSIITIEELPSAWSCNVRKRDSFYGRSPARTTTRRLNS